jgi:hypothetical protein
MNPGGPGMKSSKWCENLSFLYKERRSTMLNQDSELRQQGLPTPELISRNGRCLDDRKSRGASSSFALRSSFSWNQTASYGQMIAIKTVAAPAIFYWAKSQFNVKNMQTIRNACNWVPIESSSTAEGDAGAQARAAHKFWGQQDRGCNPNRWL